MNEDGARQQRGVHTLEDQVIVILITLPIFCISHKLG